MNTNTKEIIKDIENRTNKFHLESEIKFKENKKNINFRLQGDNKYYYASQCAKFTANVLEHGFPCGAYLSDSIASEGISFNQYSINVGFGQYGGDLKRFNSKEELLGFVIGYNKASSYFKGI